MARTLTPEQTAARDARRERFAALAGQIAEMTPEQRAAMAAQMPYLVTVEGHALSIHNACLVALQLPSATILGGYRQWQAAGRQVRKGEHGLMIWAPRMKKDADTGDEERAGFIPINLFDVSQTDAADITAAA